jgi:hypothetical protein
MNELDISYDDYLELVEEDMEADLSKLLNDRLGGTQIFNLTVHQGNRGN